jgi:hypothetical protein
MVDPVPQADPTLSAGREFGRTRLSVQFPVAPMQSARGCCGSCAAAHMSPAAAGGAGRLKPRGTAWQVNLFTFVGMYERVVGTAEHLLDKGVEFAKANGISEAEMLEWRLIDDMVLAAPAAPRGGGLPEAMGCAGRRRGGSRPD